MEGGVEGEEERQLANSLFTFLSKNLSMGMSCKNLG